MTESQELVIADVPPEEREALDAILDTAFEGRYLWHSKRTLREIPLVRAASMGGKPVGLTMLKELDKGLGYVYYIAVSADHRRRGIGGRLLDDSIRYFAERGDGEVYACAEEDNEESIALFRSRGFKITSFGEMTREYGGIKTLELYASMRAVPGEVVMVKR